MAKATTISYQQLLKDYLDNPSDSYELEYPEFVEFRKYLKESEMNTLGWNKNKMLDTVDSKKKLDKVFLAVYKKGFISSKDLKDLIAEQIEKNNMNIKAKASLIEDCNLYEVKKTSKWLNGKSNTGYELGEIKITF